jgi:hypothetical protein
MDGIRKEMDGNCRMRGRGPGIGLSSASDCFAGGFVVNNQPRALQQQ